MYLLPIVERELRIRSRSRKTFRFRLAITGVAALIAFFMISAMHSDPTPSRIGATMFQLLSWLCFGLAFVMGGVVSADLLARERREGTLGLLFLTDLHAYDVVFGKLMGVFIPSFFGLIAVFPILSITLITGGVSGVQFWRTVLALVVVLLFCMSVGIALSSWSRQDENALLKTMLVLLLLGLLGPVAQGLSLLPGVPQAVLQVAWLSPWSLLRTATDPVLPAGLYWSPLLLQLAMVPLLLALTCWQLQRSWQQKTWQGKRNAGGTVRASAPLRQRLLALHPVLWLAGRSRMVQVLAWLCPLGAVCTMLVLQEHGGAYDSVFASGGLVVGGLLGFSLAPLMMPMTLWALGFKCLIALEATRFFSEARRNSALEILITTPLTMRDLARGQWLALQRTFLLPGVLLLAAMVFPLLWIPGLASLNLGEWFLGLVLTGYYLVDLILDVFAIGWTAMYLALRLRIASLASLLTVVLVLVLPSILFCVPDVVTSLILIAVMRSEVLDFGRRLVPRAASLG